MIDDNLPIGDDFDSFERLLRLFFIVLIIVLMAFLGLVLGDVFSTGKGDYTVTGINFDRGVRNGVLITPYVLANDPREKGKFLSDEDIEKNWNKIEYKRNEL